MFWICRWEKKKINDQCMYVCIHTYTHYTYLYTHTCIIIYVHTHTHTYINLVIHYIKINKLLLSHSLFPRPCSKPINKMTNIASFKVVVQWCGHIQNMTVQLHSEHSLQHFFILHAVWHLEPRILHFALWSLGIASVIKI